MLQFHLRWIRKNSFVNHFWRWGEGGLLQTFGFLHSSKLLAMLFPLKTFMLFQHGVYSRVLDLVVYYNWGDKVPLFIWGASFVDWWIISMLKGLLKKWQTFHKMKYFPWNWNGFKLIVTLLLSFIRFRWNLPVSKIFAVADWKMTENIFDKIINDPMISSHLKGYKTNC